MVVRSGGARSGAQSSLVFSERSCGARHGRREGLVEAVQADPGLRDATASDERNTVLCCTYNEVLRSIVYIVYTSQGIVFDGSDFFSDSESLARVATAWYAVVGSLDIYRHRIAVQNRVNQNTLLSPFFCRGLESLAIVNSTR